MLTVNSGLCLMNARVPSSGSTRKNASPIVRHPAGRDRLLGDDRHAGCARAQTLDQHLLGLVIGDGDGRGIGLGRDGDAGCEVAHLDPPGGEHGGQQRLHQSPAVLGFMRQLVP